MIACTGVSCPAFGGESVVKLIWMMSALEFQATGFRVGRAVGYRLCHAIPFMKFMEEHKPPFFFGNVVIDPDFTGGDELIYVVVAACGEINIKDAAHIPSINDPDAEAVFQFLPKMIMGVLAVREFLAPVRGLGNIPGASSFLTFLEISRNERVPI